MNTQGRRHSFMQILVLVLGLIVLTAGYAGASTVGEIWQNVPTSANDASIVPGSGGPFANFTVPLIDYNSAVTGYTPALFLNNPTFSNQVNGFNPNGDFNNSFIRITGQLFLNAGSNTADIIHDDGAVLTITGLGTVFSQPGPSFPVSSPFTISAPASGLYPYVLQYGECFGAPAQLKFVLNGGTVPIASTLFLLGPGLVGLAVVRRRLKK